MNDNPWNTDILLQLRLPDILLQLRLPNEEHVELVLRRPGYLPVAHGASVQLRKNFGLSLPVVRSAVMPFDRVHRVILSPYYCENAEHRDLLESQLRADGWETWVDVVEESE